MIKISITESDDPPEERRKLKVAQKSSRAWYLLPIFLSILGGAIAWLALRGRDPVRARNALIIGAALFGLFVALMAMAATAPSETPDETPRVASEPPVQTGRSPEEIKKQAVTVPYDLLVEHGDVYVGDIIHYTGHVVDVRQNSDGGSYAIKVEVYDTDDALGYDRMIWSNYRPETDAQVKLVEHLQKHGRGLTAVFADSDNAVNVWGTFKGLKEYNIVIDKFPVPESDVLILELLSHGDVPADRDVPRTTHSVSYDQIPDYVDRGIVESALEAAVDAWEVSNPSVDFFIVDGGDADLTIVWTHWMQGSNLGMYTERIITLGGQDVTRHEISIRLGDDDCTSEYRQYSHDALKRTIAHEMGHYLGLRHIDDPGHLMHSDSLFGERDDIFSYDSRGYSIPQIPAADSQFVITGELLDEMERTDRELSVAVQEHRDLMSMEDAGQARLDESKNRINSLTLHLAELEERIACVGEPEDLSGILSALS